MGFGCLRRLGVENFDREEEEGFRGRERDGKDEALVPDRAGGAGIIWLGRGAAIGVEVGNDVGLEIAASPVDVLEVLGGDDGYLEVERPQRRRRRRRGSPWRFH